MNRKSNTITDASLIQRLLTEELNVQKYWNTLRRRWQLILLTSGVLAGAALLVALLSPSIYQATGKLLFKPDRKPELVGLKPSTEDGRLRSITQKADPLTTQAELLRSQQIIEATVQKFGLKDDDGEPLDERGFHRNLVVRQVPGADILEVSYRAKDADQSAAIVNHLMQSYIDYSITSNRSDAAAARRFIQDQLPGSEAAVSKAEAQLRQFKEENGVIVLEQESRKAVESLSLIDARLTDLRSQQAQATARIQELRSQVGDLDTDTALRVNTVNQADGVRKALTGLQEVRADLAKQRVRFASGHPAILALQRQEAEAITLLQTRIAETVGSDADVAANRLEIGNTAQEQVAKLATVEVELRGINSEFELLQQERQRYVQRSRQLPGLEKMQRELERQMEAAQTTYKTLLTKLQEAQVVENQTFGNAEIAGMAEPPKTRVSPSLLLHLLIGSGIGLLLGVIAAFVLELRDRSVRTLQEARSLFDYPVLGVIPKVDSIASDLSASLFSDRDGYQAQEAFQILQTNLKFVLSDHKLRSLVITSSACEEGKSSVVANLAMAMEQVERRVLLVDADLRNPCQHHIWDLVNRTGLSNVIVGQVSFEDAVQRVSSNLHVLTAGSIPPNPIALLDSLRMAELIRQFVDRYDMVLFDSPALSGTADATILNKLTDGSLLVVRPGTITETHGQTVKQYLIQTEQTVLGTVVNGIDLRQEPEGTVYYQPVQALPGDRLGSLSGNRVGR
jgi:capsular exopolysaccharide synthesis family protein